MRVVYIFVMKFDSYTFKLNRIFYYTIKPMLYWKKTVWNTINRHVISKTPSETLKHKTILSNSGNCHHFKAKFSNWVHFLIASLHCT